MPSSWAAALTRGPIGASLIACIGCGAGAKKQALDVTIANDQQRQEVFEATLRTLDEHPEYVDELFARARKHPRTLERFIANAAHHMHEDAIARMTTRYLVQNPAGLQRVMVRTLDAAAGKPAAKRAIAEAMRQRAGPAADALATHPEALRASVIAVIDVTASRPEARKAFLQAMNERAPALASLLIQNPRTLETVMKSTLAAAARQEDGRVLQVLRELLDPD
jgi:hypothetical protein